MWRIITLLMGLMGSIPVPVWASGMPEMIRLFVAGPQSSPWHSAIDIRIYDVTIIGETASALSKQISEHQPTAEQQARLLIEKNLSTIRRALRKEIELQSLIERFGIIKFPAAVVNDSWLIYGVTDIDDIVTAWQVTAW